MRPSFLLLSTFNIEIKGDHDQLIDQDEFCPTDAQHWFALSGFKQGYENVQYYAAFNFGISLGRESWSENVAKCMRRCSKHDECKFFQIRGWITELDLDSNDYDGSPDFSCWFGEDWVEDLSVYSDLDTFSFQHEYNAFSLDWSDENYTEWDEEANEIYAGYAEFYPDLSATHSEFVPGQSFWAFKRDYALEHLEGKRGDKGNSLDNPIMMAKDREYLIKHEFNLRAWDPTFDCQSFEEEKTCSLLSAMKSKDIIAQSIDSAIGQQKKKIEKRFLKQLGYGVYDKKFFAEKKVEHKCAKELSSELPKDFLENCQFKEGQDISETISNICSGMDTILRWAFEDCSTEKVGRGNKRARIAVRALGNLCRRMEKKYSKKP